MLAQAISSGANFAMGIFLVRALSPEGFGWHGIGMALILFYSGVGNALFLTQMIVLAPEVKEGERRTYYQNMLTLTFKFTGACAILTISITVVLYIFQRIDVLYFISTIFACACFLMNNFFVKHAYSAALEKLALMINVSTSLCLAFGMLLAYLLSGAMSPEISLGIYGLAQFMGALFGFGRSGLSKGGVTASSSVGLFKQTFLHGRWALAGVLITWLQTQSYVYITGLMLGVSSVALLIAGRIIVSPFNLLLPALGNLMLPRLAKARLRGPAELTRLTSYFGIFLIGLGITYLTVVMLGGKWLIPFLIGPAYEQQQLLSISLGWCCVLIFQLSTSAASLGMQASLRFKNLSLLNGISATVTITATLPLTMMLGPLGSIIAIGIGEAILGTALWVMLRKKK